uniref:Uncharacterized protein n=1 Tax=Cannabis sativa TaxID=3483 RepID=A0A803Q128_CANSA
MGADLFSLSSSSNLGTTDKGKEVFLGDTFGLTASGNLLSQGDGFTSKDNLPNYTEKANLMNNIVIDPNTLMDVPITYDTGSQSLKKIEGPSKRRKVIPRRSKINKGIGPNDANVRKTTTAEMEGSAKEISMVDLTFAMNLEAANSASLGRREQ